jgi:hypothetical protein
LLEFIGRSKSQHLMKMAFGGGAMSSVNTCKTYKFLIPNYNYRTDRFPGRKGIPHNHVDLCYMCDTYSWQRRSIFIGDNPILSSERMLHKDYGRKGSVAIRVSGRDLEGLEFKTNWLAVNRQSWSKSDSDSKLSQLRVSVARSVKLIAEISDRWEIQNKCNVRRWQPLPSNG